VSRSRGRGDKWKSLSPVPEIALEIVHPFKDQVSADCIDQEILRVPIVQALTTIVFGLISSL
jgi:hypothetical protein